MKSLLLFLSILTVQLTYGQEPRRLLISLRNSCSYIQAPNTGSLYAFRSSEEALEIIRQICKVDGIDPNFQIYSANVPNAKAVFDNKSRIILYSESFIQKINLLSHTNWAGVSILAHEIGHHLNGHTLDETSTRPELELKADQFSGFILRKLGASLENAQIAINTLCPNDGTAMYPPKSARLEAIAVGWQSGEDVSPKDFSKFLNTLPRILKSKSFWDEAYHLDYRGKGEISLQLDNDKLKISGRIEYNTYVKTVGHNYFASGNFSGLYFINPSIIKRNFPYIFIINADGTLEYGSTEPNGMKDNCDFEKITLVIKNENDIQCSINALNQFIPFPINHILFH